MLFFVLTCLCVLPPSTCICAHSVEKCTDDKSQPCETNTALDFTKESSLHLQQFPVTLDTRTLQEFPVQRDGGIITINIAKEIGINQSEMFGLELLGMDRHNEIDIFINKNTETANIRILRHWLDKRGSLKKPITFRTLISVIRKLGLAEVAEEMTATCETFKIMDVHHVPSSVKEYSQQLSLKFEQQLVIDQTQWLPKRLRGKNITFVDLELKEKGRNISLFDLLGIMQSGTRILLVGQPGVGKTTITRYLSKQLIHNGQFNLVIKLHLGLTGTLDSLNSILQVNADESFDPSDRDIVASYINKKVGEGTCFLLDGLDEYDYKDSNYITSLIQGDKLAKSVVIVTSRPSAIEDYEVFFDRKAEIIGFGEKGIQTYLEQLQLSSTEYQIIHQYLSIHPNIRQLCYLPLHLSMLVYVAIDNIGSLSLVDTETKLYTSFLYLTIKQYEFVRHVETVESLKECFNDLYKESKLCILIRIISRNAFEGVISNEQTFTSLSFTGLPEDVSSEIEALSLFKVETFYDTRGSKVQKYYYSHPTFQEFFTAIHLVTLPREEQLSYIKLSRMREVYKFFVGLIGSELRFDDETVSQTFINFAMKELATYQDQELHIVKCAHEVGRISQFTNYLQAVHVITDSNSMHVKSWYDHDCWYVGYTLSQSFLHELTVDKHSELPSCISVISNYLKHDHETLGRIHVTKLTLGSPSNYWPWFTDKESDINTVGELFECLPTFHNYLTKLELLFIKFEHSASILHLGEILKSFSKLKCLSLSVNVSVIKEGHLESALEDLVQLEYLELGVINKHDDDTVIPENLLEFKNLKQLQGLKLFISWNKDLVDVNMTSLIGGLVYLTELKSLTIQMILYTGFRDNGAFELIQGIKKNSGINDLALHLDLCWDFGLGNVTTEHLVAALKNMTMMLKTLSLCVDFNFSGIKGSSDVIKLANGLKHLTKLQELDIELRWELLINDDIDGATKALVDGLKYLPNLKALKLSLQQNGSCSELVSLFKFLTELRELTLTLKCNEKTVVIPGLKYLKHLRKLIISWNNFDDEIMVPLTEALKQMKHLHTLDLSNNKIGDTGLKLLSEVIDSSYLTHLQILLLNSNQFTELGVKELSKKVIKLSHLYTLKFDDSWRFDSYSGQALAQIIVRNKTLTLSRIESSDQYCDVTFNLVAQITILLCSSAAVGGFLCFISFNLGCVLTSKTHQAWPRKGISEKLAQGIFSTSSAWKLERLKKHGLDGSGTVIVILDTAIDFSCPAFLHKSILDFDYLPQVPKASNEHGSVCAAIAVGSSYCTTSSITVPDGVAPGAQLIVYRIAEGDYCYNEAVVAALDDIKLKVESGTQIDVVSISYDLCEDSREEIHKRIKSLTEEGVVFVAAAGNRGRYQAHASIPARFDFVISVGALDRNGFPSPFNACGRIDVFAPGEDIPGPSSSSILFWGTSFATPAVTGLVSLLKQCANKVGPPARENIHRVTILRHIFKEHMIVRSDSGQVDVFDPVGFFLNVIDTPNLLNEIVKQHMGIEDMEQ